MISPGWQLKAVHIRSKTLGEIPSPFPIVAIVVGEALISVRKFSLVIFCQSVISIVYHKRMPFSHHPFITYGDVFGTVPLIMLVIWIVAPLFHS